MKRAAGGDFAERTGALLGHDSVEVRCAAALVLGAGGKGDAAAARALLDHLGDRDPVLVGYVLEALEALVPLPGALAGTLVERVSPHCASADGAIRARALRLVAGHADGKAGEKVLAAQLGDPQTGAPAREAAAALLVKSGSAAADAALLGSLGDPAVGEHVLQLLRAELDAKGGARHNKLAERAEAALGKLGKDAPAARRAALLRLVGYLGQERTLPLLVRTARAAGPVELRVAAIAAMRRALAAAPKPLPKVVEPLLDLADDAETTVAHAAVDTLSAAKIPPALAGRLARLMDARNPEARRLAAARLGQAGSKEALPALVAAVAAGDPAALGAARRSLASTDGAGAALAQALSAATDEAAAQRLVAALRPHEHSLPSRALDALAARAEKALGSETDRAGRVIHEVLARAAPDRYLALVLGRARKLRRAGDLAAAWTLLRPVLVPGATLPDADRFFAATTGLLVERKSLLRAARTVDPVLVAFRALNAAGFAVTRALGKEKDVPADAMFMLGFNLIESTDENDRALGEELLGHIVAASPRSKLALAARNKLKLSAQA